ncbi:Retrovirus-related Pol polyprotein from type-1 retrotransposable element R1 [Aphis craccivora]|uniref:Retrovirus-related Pol polyprotein from type-1 retrotransposable element R1 n=1 Tax=Aphis craccivora TaxID=307492 RepID=A0A6G0Y3B3_APHCR|nr:Retrovirus-related Pol polyprotein from type-1 retrotransposable element R1 [Aphis craccivora]
MARRVENWRATDDLTSNDHAVIVFDIQIQLTAPGILRDPLRIKYDWRTTDWTEFRKTLKTLKNMRSAELGCPDDETCTRALSEVLVTACETHMKQVRVARLKPPP